MKWKCVWLEWIGCWENQEYIAIKIITKMNPQADIIWFYLRVAFLNVSGSIDNFLTTNKMKL